MLKSLSTKFRLSLGLASILASLLMTAAFLGVIPDRNSAILEGRAALAETIAANSSIFITRSDLRRMEANLSLIIERNEEILSAAVVDQDSTIVLEVGDHQNRWQELEGGSHNTSQLSVPIMERHTQWGQIQLRFQPLTPVVWYGFIYNPLLQLLSFIGLFAFIGFYFYLGRMLKHLDPSQAIPDRVRSALNTMAEGLLVLDAKQNIVLANEAFSQIVDRESQELLGKPISLFPWANTDDSPVTDRETPWGIALREGEAQTSEMLRLPVAEGCSKTFMINCSPVLNSNGKAAGVLISFDDVTELEEKEIELRKSKEVAEQANRAKSDFLANMSHEIRTPMNAILGFTEVLKRGYGNSTQESLKYLNTISSSGQHLLNLINDILDLSKVEADKIEVEKIPCPAHEIIKEVVSIMAVKAQEKAISLEYIPEGPLPEHIQSDPARLRQILTNLVGNAIKFTEQGGVTIVTRMDDPEASNILYLEVRDTGIGMTEEQAGRIFNPFEQADSSTTRRFGGTGLGLTISKRFAQALGGDIFVRSEEGKGSNFVTLIDMGTVKDIPLLQPDEILTETEIVAQTNATQWQFPDARILVVDDGAENRDLLTVVLSELGLRIDTAENGQEGCDMLFSGNYDLVLMDVNMPVMGGYEAVGIMRDKGYDLPIIALTANAMKGAAEECLNAGYSGYMAKPIDIDQLTGLLVEKLDGKPLEQQQDETETEQPPQPTPAAITSSLTAKNPKLHSIVEKFVARLEEQLKTMADAWQKQDYQALADLAHWLKGSAGSVGFAQFTEVAAQLESFAKERKGDKVPALLAELNQLYTRIRLADETGESNAPSTEESKHKYDIPEVLNSRLPANRDTFRNIIQKFAIRLEEQLVQMETALEREDFDTLADIGHWLKGTAGSVGFDAFTEPASELETFAKAKQPSGIVPALSAIQEMSRRMVVPSSEQDQEQERLANG